MSENNLIRKCLLQNKIKYNKKTKRQRVENEIKRSINEIIKKAQIINVQVAFGCLSFTQ